MNKQQGCILSLIYSRLFMNSQQRKDAIALELKSFLLELAELQKERNGIIQKYQRESEEAAAASAKRALYEH